jgi:hypothetical protein
MKKMDNMNWSFSTEANKVYYFKKIGIKNRFLWWSDTFDFINKLPFKTKKMHKKLREKENQNWNKEFEESFY